MRMIFARMLGLVALAGCGGDGAAVDLAAGAGDLSTGAGDFSSGGGDLPSSADLAHAADLSGAVDLAVVDAWICTGVCPDYMLEPNNTPAQATVESDTVSLPNLALCPRNDLDFYKVTAHKKGTLTVQLALGPCGPLLAVDLLAADGTTVVGASTPTTAGAMASAAVDQNAVRYVRVTPKNAGDQNFYALALSLP
jgi:hypothetical protein